MQFAHLENKRYKIIAKIAEGAHSEIFKAEDMERGGERVAMKVVELKSGQRREVYEREVHISSLLHHPNLATARDHYIVNGRYGVLVLELMDMDLMDLLLDAPLLSIKELLWVFGEVCKGLGFMHSLHIAHCDIKPENILLKMEGGKVKKVMIGDMGYGVEWRKEGKVPHMGTPQYLPPELGAFPCEVKAEKVDVWSMGVVLFVMLTGLFPFVERRRRYFALDLSSLRSLISAQKFDVKEMGYNAFVDDHCPDLELFLSRLFSFSPSPRPSLSLWSSYSFLRDCLKSPVDSHPLPLSSHPKLSSMR